MRDYKKLRKALEFYASKDEWISEVVVCGETAEFPDANGDVPEWEMAYDLGIEQVLNTGEAGYKVAQEVLAETSKDSEVERLVVWLQDSIEHNYGAGPRVVYYREVLAHIKSEFGCGGG